MRTIWGNHARFEKDWLELPGCYITGDLATKDEEGYIQVIGRADDVLNVAGHRIGTAEVESALVSHPAVAEAAAIGIPDPLKGEAIVAFAQLRAGHVASDALTASLIEHVTAGNWGQSPRHRRSSSLARCPRHAREKLCAGF